MATTDELIDQYKKKREQIIQMDAAAIVWDSVFRL